MSHHLTTSQVALLAFTLVFLALGLLAGLLFLLRALAWRERARADARAAAAAATAAAAEVDPELLGGPGRRRAPPRSACLSAFTASTSP